MTIYFSSTFYVINLINFKSLKRFSQIKQMYGFLKLIKKKKIKNRLCESLSKINRII